MAYHKPTDLDGFINQMGKADMRIRAQLAEDLVNYLSDSENSLACSDLGMLIDGLVPWLSGSHFKVKEKAARMRHRPAVNVQTWPLRKSLSYYTPGIIQAAYCVGLRWG